jgi:ABC-type transporter Mla subunit MlaD
VAIKQTLSETHDIAQRIERIRRLCDDLSTALDSADKQRELLAQMKRDADDVYKALNAKR